MTVTTSSYNVSAISVLVLASNITRKETFILNNGANDLYIGTATGVTTTTGICVPPQHTLNDKKYTGTYYAITVSNLSAVNVRVIEVN